MNTNIDRPVWQLTVRELLDILNPKTEQIESSNPTTNSETEYVYGISGLARILGCSKTHAQKLKSKGVFDKAIIQNGRKIIINKELALQLFKENSNE